VEAAAFLTNVGREAGLESQWCLFMTCLY